MPDAAQLPIPGTEAPAPATPPEPIVAAAQPAPTPVAPKTESGYTYGDDVHELIRGRSASEVAQMFGKLANLTIENMKREQPAPTPPPAAPANNGQSNGIDAQLVDRVTRQAASLSYGLAQQTHADTFKRYKAEIDGMLQGLPLHQWTPDTINLVVRSVKGEHAEEIATERVRASQEADAARSMGAMRSNGGAAHAAYGTESSMPQTPGTIAEQMAQTPASWQAHAKAVGLGDREVQEICRSMDIEPSDFFAQFKGGLISDAVADVQPGMRKS